ncbi:hypothetical protein [Roseovarius sp. MBR-6]|jgi:hypothetical protein|uniref:hypothetical protein n=1 Tax=Roseovarius sp. MBR-6 TaxID=3156459 RepID=UPI0033955B2F
MSDAFSLIMIAGPLKLSTTGMIEQSAMQSRALDGRGAITTGPARISQFQSGTQRMAIARLHQKRQAL